MDSASHVGLPQRGARNHALDGIRFVLFLCIYWFHINPGRHWKLGYALPCFFVLSGFLITQQLQLAKDSGTSLRRILLVFYGRRLLRIIPPFWISLGLFGIFLGAPYLWTKLTFTLNLALFWESHTTRGMEALMETIGREWWRPGFHFWSLCIEEQFYLAFPLPFLYFRKQFRYWGPATILGCVLLRIAHQTFHPQAFYGVLPWISGEYLMWGALGAVVSFPGPMRSWVGSLAIYLGLLLLPLFYALYPMHTVSAVMFWRPSHMQTLFGAAFALIVWGMHNSPANLISRGLSFRPLVWLGIRTYAMYLSHLLAWSFTPWLCRTFPVLGTPSHPLRLAVIITLAIGSWYLVESPFLKIKDRLSFGSRQPVPSGHGNDESSKAA